MSFEVVISDTSRVKELVLEPLADKGEVQVKADWKHIAFLEIRKEGVATRRIELYYPLGVIREGDSMAMVDFSKLRAELSDFEEWLRRHVEAGPMLK